MLNTLVMLGYVSRVPDSRRFRLTLKVIDLGLHAIGRADLRETARPILRSLVGEVNEAASLGVLDGADVLYIDRVRAGLTRIGVDIRIGTTIPAYCSAIGAGHSGLSAGRRNWRVCWLPRHAPAVFPNKPMTKDEIKRDLADVREHGYALRDSYFGSGLRILAVPVLDLDNYPVAAVSVAAPAGPHDEQGIPEPRARAGAPRGQGYRPHHPGQRNRLCDSVRLKKTKTHMEETMGMKKMIGLGHDRYFAGVGRRRDGGRHRAHRVDAGRIGLVCRRSGDGTGF